MCPHFGHDRYKYLSGPSKWKSPAWKVIGLPGRNLGTHYHWCIILYEKASVSRLDEWRCSFTLTATFLHTHFHFYSTFSYPVTLAFGFKKIIKITAAVTRYKGNLFILNLKVFGLFGLCKPQTCDTQADRQMSQQYSYSNLPLKCIWRYVKNGLRSFLLLIWDKSNHVDENICAKWFLIFIPDDFELLPLDLKNCHSSHTCQNWYFLQIWSLYVGYETKAPHDQTMQTYRRADRLMYGRGTRLNAAC